MHLIKLLKEMTVSIYNQSFVKYIHLSPVFHGFKQLKILILPVFVMNFSNKIIHLGDGLYLLSMSFMFYTSFSYSLLNVNDNKTKHFLMTRIYMDKHGISLYGFLLY